MADTKITGLTAIDALDDADVLPVVDDPAGTPETKKVTASQVKSYIGAYAPDGTDVAVADGGTGASDASTARTNLGVPSDPAAGTAGMRTLGTGATQAAAGDDGRLSDERTPTDNSVTNAKMADDAVGVAELSATGTADGTTFLRGDNTWGEPPGTSDPLAMKGVVHLIYDETNSRYEHGDGTVPDLTGRVADIMWQGTAAQIPAQGTGDAQFRVTDLAHVRATGYAS